MEKIRGLRANKNEGTVIGVERNEGVMSQRGANTLIVCDMIRLQIRLRAVLARLDASPKRKVSQGLRVDRNGIEPARLLRPGS